MVLLTLREQMFVWNKSSIKTNVHLKQMLISLIRQYYIRVSDKFIVLSFRCIYIILVDYPNLREEWVLSVVICDTWYKLRR